MKNSLMVALASTFALLTLVAGCASGPALNPSFQKPDIDGRYLIERDPTGMPVRQITLPSSSDCRGALRGILDIVHVRTRAGVPSNEYRCEEFEVFGLRYRGEISCDICEMHFQVAARTKDECELAMANFKSDWQTMLLSLASEDEISADDPDFQSALNELKITECRQGILGERHSPGRFLDDSLLEFRLRSQVRQDESLGDAVNISVTSFNGIVLLTGEVRSDEQRRRAGEIVAGNKSTRKLVNELQLAGKTNVIGRANDTLLTGKVKAQLIKDENTSPTIKVVTEHGKVYLLGLVTQAEAEAAVESARAISGVTHIVKVFEYIE